MLCGEGSLIGSGRFVSRLGGIQVRLGVRIRLSRRLRLHDVRLGTRHSSISGLYAARHLSGDEGSAAGSHRSRRAFAERLVPTLLQSANL